MSVDEALYILGKNLLGQNVTDRLFPIAKQVVTGFNQVGEGLSTIGGVLPPVALPTGKLITIMEVAGRLWEVARANQSPHIGKNNVLFWSFQQLPALSLGPFNGFFELTNV